MKTEKVEYIILRNDFHNTAIRLRVIDSSHESECFARFQLSNKQVKRAKNKLCGVAFCFCSDDLGMRGTQDRCYETDICEHSVVIHCMKQGEPYRVSRAVYGCARIAHENTIDTAHEILTQFERNPSEVKKDTFGYTCAGYAEMIYRSTFTEATSYDDIKISDKIKPLADWVEHAIAVFERIANKVWQVNDDI